MQSVSIDCTQVTDNPFDDSIEIDGLTRFFNNVIHQAWLMSFTGLIIGILSVRYAGLSFSLTLSSIFIFINAIWSIRNGISNSKRLVFCLCFTAMASTLRYYDEIHGLSGDDIRGIVKENRPRLLKFHGIVTDREIIHRETSSDSLARIVLKTDLISGHQSNRPSRGSILIEANPDQVADIHIGMPISIYGWLESLPEAMNPGDFSWANYWQSRQVHALINFRNHALIETNPDESPSYWRYYLDRARQRCRNCISSAVAIERVPLLEALVLGIRESVSQNDRRLFRDSGTLHLLAISGLHLQVIAIFMMMIARRLKCNLVATACIVILTSSFYTLLVGSGASVIRATLMTSVVSLAMARNQPGHFWSRMLLAGSIILWLRPSQLFDAGCQLSFLGTAGIQFASEFWHKIGSRLNLKLYQHPLEKLMNAFRKPEFLQSIELNKESIPAFIVYLLIVFYKILLTVLVIISGAIIISSVVWLFTAFLVAFHFSALNPVAILVNLPLVPATSLALIMSLIGICLSIIGLGLPGRLLLQFAGWLMSICISVLDWSLNNLMPPVTFHTPDILFVLLFYLFLFLVMIIYHSSLVQRLQYIAITIIIAFLLIPIIFYARSARNEFPDHLEMHVLAVEHGLAIIIRWPDGQNWLYDCGQMGSPAVGEKIVVPSLEQLGIRQIDRLFISHADADHFNGIPGLLDSEIKIKSVYTSPHFIRSRQPDAIDLKNRLTQMKIPIEPLSAGDILLNQTSAFARVLHPGISFSEFRADNSTSLVIEIQYNGQNCILTGDLENQGLIEMHRYFTEKNHAKSRASVIIAPHHGGITSNPEWFYESFQPEIVISSQGRGRFGLANSLESRMKAISPDSRLYITARDGSIQMKWTPQGILVSTFRQNQFISDSAPATHVLKMSDARAAKALLNPQ